MSRSTRSLLRTRRLHWLAFLLNLPSMAFPGFPPTCEKIGPIVYFPRMLDKIRLHIAGNLTPDYIANLGEGFDKACVGHLGIDYAALVERVKSGGSDEEIFQWAQSHGRPLTEQDHVVWNEFMRKRGWNDVATERLLQRKAENGFTQRDDIQTFFDFIDADEGRK